MRLKSAKQKGTRLEKQFSDLLVASGLDKYSQRMILSGAVKGFDGDIKTSLPIHVECKNTETWQPLAYYKQCELSNPSPARKMNIVVMSKNRLPEPMIMMAASDFINLALLAKDGGWK